MTEPYRGEPEQDPELEKLAAHGHARRKEQDSLAREAERGAGAANLNAALAPYLGSSRGIGPLVAGAIGLGGVLLAVLVGEWARPLGVVGAFIAFIATFAWRLSSPTVSAEEMATERAWSTSFAFALDGYFDVLSKEPSASRSVVYDLRWKEGATPPTVTLLDGVFAAADPGAMVEHVDQRGARVRSGAISGATGARVNRELELSNHALPPHVHAVVEKVLVPLHRSHPLESVTLSA